MTEPSPPAPPPSPFDRSGEPAPIGPGGSGVRRPLLVGCAVLVGLVLVALVLFVAYQNSIAAWMFEALQSELEPMLPEDLPEEVRTRYEEAFAGAIAAAREGRYDATGLQRVQREFTRLARSGSSRLSLDDVERLTEILESVPRSPEGAEAPTAEDRLQE